MPISLEKAQQCFAEDFGHDSFEELVEEGFWDCDSTGVCFECGHVQDGVEPDAEGYSCEECGKPAVNGAMFLIGC